MRVPPLACSHPPAGGHFCAAKVLHQKETPSGRMVFLFGASGNTEPICPKKEKPNRSPAQRVRFGKEEQRHERALTYKISRSKRYRACSDVVRAMGLEPTRPYGHKHLKLACLPIPARSLTEYPAIIAKPGSLSRGGAKFPPFQRKTAAFRIAPCRRPCYNCAMTCPMGASMVTAAPRPLPAPPLLMTTSLLPR